MADNENQPNNGPSPFLFEKGSKILHENILIDMMASLYEKSINSDISLEVDGRKFKAHRAILAAQSPVFETMLLGASFKEAKDEVIKLPEKNADSFEVFLRYLYTCMMRLDELDLDAIVDILNLANYYQVNELLIDLAHLLTAVINDESVFQIFECAHLLNIENLLDACHEYLWENAARLVKCEQMIELSKPALIDLISNDQFFAPEVDILFAVQAWQKKYPEQGVKDVLAHVRFPYVTLDGMKMARAAPLYKLLIDNDIDIEIAADETNPQTACAPRKAFAHMAKENVATTYLGVTVEGAIDPVDVDYLLDTPKSDWHGFLHYGSPIVIMLNAVFRIGSMSFDIYGGGKTSQPCFYTIETADDTLEWKNLVDCRNYSCYREQLIMFQPRFIQYIRVTAFQAVNNDTEDSYAIQSFQCSAEKISAEERAIYVQQCQGGKTMLYQRHSKTVKIFD